MFTIILKLYLIRLIPIKIIFTEILIINIPEQPHLIKKKLSGRDKTSTFDLWPEA